MLGHFSHSPRAQFNFYFISCEIDRARRIPSSSYSDPHLLNHTHHFTLIRGCYQALWSFDEREEGKVFWMQSCIVIKIWRQTARDEIHLMAQILYELLFSSIPRANFYEGRGAGKIPTKTNCQKFPLNATRIICQKLPFVSSTQQNINLAL